MAFSYAGWDDRLGERVSLYAKAEVGSINERSRGVLVSLPWREFAGMPRLGMLANSTTVLLRSGAVDEFFSTAECRADE